jgi:hypothetical protein
MNIGRTRTARPSGRREDRPSGQGTGQIAGAHNAKKSYERYIELAQAAALAGNRVDAENYFQHAEHYFRCAAANGRPTPAGV